MKVSEDGRVVELTERNLRSLLAKLSGYPSNSACAIAKDGWIVRAVPDEAHYADRDPGVIHPDTQEHLADD